MYHSRVIPALVVVTGRKAAGGVTGCGHSRVVPATVAVTGRKSRQGYFWLLRLWERKPGVGMLPASNSLITRLFFYTVLSCPNLVNY